MTSHQTAARQSWGRSVAVVIGSALLFSGCAGENLFSIAASLSDVGPKVTITAPSEGFTIGVGDSILVIADVNAPNGAVSAEYSGTYTTGEAAYTAETEALGGLVARLDNKLRAVDAQVAGSVYIVVVVTDQTGGQGKDSVKVTIN